MGNCRNNRHTKTLSKAFAIMLAFFCAAAFMPLLNGPAFAKAKKPAQVQDLVLTQAETMETAGKYTITAEWAKVKKNVKKYRVEITDVTVSNGISEETAAVAAPEVKTVKKKVTSVTFDGAVGSTYQVKVRALNGKKKGAWSETQEITVVDKRTPLTSVSIKKTYVIKPGFKLTATLVPEGAPVTWQWYRVKDDTEIAIEDATKPEYKATAADVGFYLKVVAKAGYDNLIYNGAVNDITDIPVTANSGGGGGNDPIDPSVAVR